MFLSLKTNKKALKNGKKGRCVGDVPGAVALLLLLPEFRGAPTALEEVRVSPEPGPARLAERRKLLETL